MKRMAIILALLSLLYFCLLEFIPRSSINRGFFFETIMNEPEASLCFRRSINVAKFGKNGDSINKAIVVAIEMGLKRVFLPRGEYFIETPIILQSNIDLVGERGTILVPIDGYTKETIILCKGISNASVSNITIDAYGKNVNALAISGCNSLSIIGCQIGNINARTITRAGIVCKSSKFLLIESCSVHDVIHNFESGASRGIILDQCDQVEIRSCNIYNILRLESSKGEKSIRAIDADAIHLLSDAKEYNHHICIQNCEITDCSGRYIKVQCNGVKIKDCSLVQTTIRPLEPLAIFDSEVLVEGCEIESYAPIAIHIGGASGTFCDNTIRDVLIERNCIRHLAIKAYQGAITLRDRPMNGITISNNTIQGGETEYGVYIRGNSKGSVEGISIRDNHFEGGLSYVVRLRPDELVPSAMIQDISITNQYIVKNLKTL